MSDTAPDAHVSYTSGSLRRGWAAECACGWHGRRRPTPNRADRDGLEHEVGYTHTARDRTLAQQGRPFF